MCEAIDISNTQWIFKRIMDSHFSDLLCLCNNGKKSDSFAAHFEQHFHSTAACTTLLKCMTFEGVNQINLIGAMKSSQNITATYVWRNV